MKRLIVLFIVVCGWVSGCAPRLAHPQPLTSLTIDTLFTGKASIRSLEIGTSDLWFGADNGRLGRIHLATGDVTLRQIDTLTSELRSIAMTRDALFILNVGSPATLFRVDLADRKETIVYREDGASVFYDSMVFRDDTHGVAVGDPVDGCLSVIQTNDGGHHWTKIACSRLPQTAAGEAAFASSNTCVSVKGHDLWMASGGQKARVFHSADHGTTWSVVDTPIWQGETMTGIFSIAFADAHTGMIAGGNYDKPTDNGANKAITHDGGKTWQLVSDGQGPGYISCIQAIPGSKGKGWVTVGATGIHRSDDAGQTWRLLSPVSDLYTVRFASPTVAYAAGRGKVVRLTFR